MRECLGREPLIVVHLTKASFGLLLVLWLCPIQGWPQTARTGALTGTITDRSGAVIPDANVKVANQATGDARTTRTNAQGVYLVSLLAPGSYRLEVGKPGFKSALRGQIQVAVTETATLDIQLEIGSTQETVNVTGESTMVQTENSALGRLTDEKAVADLPLVTRNYTQIIGLSPGVSMTVNNAGELGRGSGGVATIEKSADGTFVHGGRSYDNNFQMDGVSVNDVQASGAGSGGIPVPNPDTIQEFKVQTGLYDASYGRYAGANVNVVTKSGTNQLHGSVFEFFRNDALNANDFFLKQAGQNRPVLRQNQFGFTVGGPIETDKLFFFGSYQGTRQINGLASGQARVGCQATVNLPAITNDRSAPALGALFGGRSGALGGVAIQPDGSNINPVALALLNFKLANGDYLIPTPQVVDPSASNPDAAGLAAFSSPCRFNEDQFMTNLDYTQGTRGHLAERFFYANSDDLVTFAGGAVNSVGNVPGFPDSTRTNFRELSLNYTYVVNPYLLNESRFGFVRTVAFLKATAPFSWSDVGASEGSLGLNNDLPNLNILGSINFATGFPRQFAQNTFELADNVSYTRSAHGLRFGGTLTRFQDNLSRVGIGSFLQFLSWPDFLLGLDATGNGTGSFSNVFASVDAFGLFDRQYRAWEGSLYAQDDFKVTPRMTVNLGLRFERLGQFGDELGRNGSFDIMHADPNPPAQGSIAGYVVGSNFSGTIPSGVMRSGNAAANKGDGQNTFGPRLGFAWQVLPHSTHFILRGGYGIYFSRPSGQAFYQTIFGAPFTDVRVTAGPSNATASFAQPFAQPFPTISDFPLFPSYSPTSTTTVFTTSPDFRSSIVQQFSLNLQTQISSSTLFEIGYVGTRGTHLLRQRSLNQALVATPADPIRGETTNTIANIPMRVPILGIPPDSLVMTESEGDSWYNGLEASVTRKLTYGLQFLASYTFSKVLDTDGADVSGTSAGNVLTQGDQNDPRQRWGRANIDRTHRFIFSGLYSLPTPTDNGLKKATLGGWELSGVFTLQSGPALTVLNTNANNVFGISEDRAQIASGCVASRLVTSGSIESKLNNYFNSSCFTSPPVIGADGIGTAFGNSPTGVVDGPGQRNVDLAIIKRTAISERVNLEFRAEMFNFFNTPQFGIPDTNFSSPTFGHITSTSVNPRIIQLALKINF